MKTNDKEDAPHKSPHDFKPWEKLVAFYKPIKGVFMYQLAASQIAEAEGWSDSQMEALEAEMRWAILNGLLPQRSRKTGMVIAPDAREKLMLVTVNDVNKWLGEKLKDDDVKYQWVLQSFATQPQPQPMPLSVVSNSTKPKRRDSLTPVIEKAKETCRNANDTAEVWAALQVLAEKKQPPLIGVTEDGLQYLKNGIAESFNRDALRKRLARYPPLSAAKRP